jgi:hypothetical protein
MVCCGTSSAFRFRMAFEREKWISRESGMSGSAW